VSWNEFKARLNSELPFVDWGTEYGFYVCRKRAYLLLHFWTPLRKSEILERSRKDFSIKGQFLEISLYRKKKYYKKNDKGVIIAKPEPFYLPLQTPYINEILDYLKHFKLNERPFNFSGVTAWNYVKDIFPTKFPHFWRFDWITKAVENADDPGKLMVDLLKDTGLDVQTVVAYIMANPRFKGTISLKMLKAEGVKT
jgi:hypothetical protein